MNARNPVPLREPETADELLARARALAGRNLGELAAAFGLALPPSPARAKGYIGQLVERALGASSGSRAQADFAALGIELKTVPVDPRGRPRESTFITSLDLEREEERRWESSRVRHKLARVLWVPVESETGVPFPARRLGWPLLWTPQGAELAALREDFESLVELCEQGLGHQITARHGKVLQLRPKGADARALRWTLDGDGAPVRAAPRAFYLRARFTRELLGQAWIVAR